MMKDIVIKGARQNNLKNINVTIPRNKLVVLTGVSGSGKSTLAFDTIFAEGQRRYVESLSSYARMFLGQVNKPDVDSIDGLSPSIAIDQKTTSHNPRSTVGTVTEIYDYFRLLFAHIGVPYCPRCKKPITTQTIDAIIDKIKELGVGAKIFIKAQIVKGKKGTFANELNAFRKDGYVRVNIDGINYTLDEEINLDKNVKHTIFVVVDRLVLKEDIDQRLFDSVEQAIKLSCGTVTIESDGIDYLYSTTHFCDECGYSIDDLSPKMFSFNNPYGACPTCKGLGFNQIIDVKKFNIDKTQSVQKSGLNSVGLFAYDPSLLNMYYRSVANHYGVAEDTPICDMPKGMFDTILYGTKGEKISVVHKFGVVSDRKMAFEGIVPIAERRYRETTGEFTRNELGKYITEEECPHCLGRRLREDVLSVYINKQNISTLCDKSVEDLIDFFSKLKLNETEKIIAEPILKEINARLGFLNDVGLDYLTLSRRAGSLSGGEAQRIRLATQIGSGLTGVIYILDEPSIGLHQRDNDKLIGTLKHLRDLGNTVIVVEHDEDTMREADYIIDIGRLAGVHGGKIVAEGTVEDIMANEKSLTGQYLSGKLSIPVPKTRRPQTKDVIKITGCRQNNLKKVDLEIPIGLITLVTGVSGSGKSSLINETLYPIVYNHINKSNLMEGKHSKVTGLEYIDKVINIDQSPIGKTPRSNPATYTNVFTDIRQLFASTIDAKERGYTSGRFSFNIAGGRCENCGGAGIKQIEMFFLPDVYVPCEICDGKRYNRETLEVKYKGKSIYDVLEMTISEANEFFANIPKIKNKLQTLVDVGLGYVKLGQPATELSGGEAQRVKLATELSKRATGKSLYILDEPTTGLHLYDIDKLVKILYRLVESGNTIVVIEHNLDVIKCADHIIDMGMEGGSKGGEIIATGTPEEIVKNNVGYTAKYLKKYLKK